MTRALRLLLTGSILALSFGVPSRAKSNITEFPLEYRPTLFIAAAEVDIDPSLLEQPLQVRFTDRRSTNDTRWIGSRSDDDDRIHPLTATNDVAAWTGSVVIDSLESWGILVTEDEVPRVLTIELVELKVDEANQAVGAMYRGSARLRLQLGERQASQDGAKFMASGDATRYGKKFSSENANEVISDALIEALAAGVRTLSRSRRDSPEVDADPAAIASSTIPGEVLRRDPPKLLAEVRELMGEGLTTETVVNYVRQCVLSRALNAADLVEWKQAGVPEEVLHAAMALPVR